MISSISWVPRGAANPNPPRFQVCQQEVEVMKAKAEAIMKGGKGDEEEGEEEEDQDEEEEDLEVEESQKGKMDQHGLPVELRMDDYDDEEEGEEEAAFVHADEDEEEEEEEDEEDEEDEDMMEEEEEEGEEDDDEEEVEADALAGMAPGSDFMREVEENEDDDDESEAEDNQIRLTDAVVLVANTEDEEHSALEVHIYEEETGQLYVHHDITLPAFPLALAWGDCPPCLNEGGQGGRGSFVALGTFRTGIEIWDLDVIDPLEPLAILGGEQSLHPSMMGEEEGGSKKTKKGKKKAKRRAHQAADALVEGSHEGPVMSLAWNRIHRQVLASGSADTTVKLWDVTTQQCSSTFSHHKDKVVSLQWHPIEGTVLASAGFDRGVHVLDARGGGGASASSCAMAIQADPECIGWVPHAPSTILCSTEDGSLVAWDVRSPMQVLWKLPQAHAKTLSSFSFSPLAPGLLATCGLDKIVKLWDMKEGNQEPIQIGEKAMAAGKLFTISFYASSPFLLAAGGDKGLLAIWDLHEVDAVMNRFSSAAPGGEVVAESMEKMNIAAAEEERKVANTGKENSKQKKKAAAGGGGRKRK